MNKNLPSIALRLGLAFVLSYAAVSSLLEPQNWVGYFPRFLFSILPERFLLPGFSIAQIILAVWLLSGRRLKWASLVSAGMMAGITLFNLNLFEVTFRDVGLFFMAVALWFLA
ncbi:MAG: DoxX family membrane protein [Candidatus Liptonbacteria bacterium]|nr:DoxX family membrane protein [Candidatus Liptonbacteria bacterium]